MPSSEPTECMYHGDRAGFAVLTRELKRNRVLPKPYLTRIASAVCSCRKCSKSSYKYVVVSRVFVQKMYSKVELQICSCFTRVRAENVVINM